MSIAKDEAFHYISQKLDGKDYLTGNSLYRFPVPTWDIIRKAYIAGRTAEPTEAEIEAAARVFFRNLHYPSASLDWDKATDYVKDNWRLKTRLALTAARKAVAGDE